MHLGVPANAPRLRATSIAENLLADSVGTVVVHWCESVEMRGLHFPQGIVDSIVLASGCLADDWFVALVDSGISHRGERVPLLSERQMAELRARLDERHRELLDHLDSLAESCIESLTRYRLHLEGIRVRSQVVVAQGLRVDFVLDDDIVIEVDGARFHSGPEQFEADRARDAILKSLGFRVLHFSYRQIVDDWPGVLDTILSVRTQKRSRRGH